MKKVLIAAPIGGQKQYSINTWFEWIANQTYKNYDFLLCTNAPWKELYEKTGQVEITDVHGQTKKPIRLYLYDSDRLTIIQKITYSREKIRRYAVEHNYDALLWLDTDTIPINPDAISMMLDKDKESLSGLYFYKSSRQPIIIDKETHTNITLSKCEELYDKDEICEIWGSGYGCVMHQGKALLAPFDYDMFKQERSDDFGHCQVLEDRGIKRYFYPKIICAHLGASKFIDHMHHMQRGKDNNE